VATPPVRVAVPRLVLPAEKETEPVGLSPLTVAFNVICPFTLPPLGACRVVELAAGEMVTAVATEVLAVLLLSPEYVAVTV
jgi:hypothetical protein